MNTILKYFIFAISLLFVSQFSEANVINCENCIDTKRAAINSVRNVPGRYTIHVADTQKKNIISYSIRVIDMEGEPGFPSVMISAYQITTSSALAGDFQQLIDAIETFVQEASQITASTTEIGIDSAWDLYADNAAQTAFLNYVYANANLSQVVTSLGNQALEVGASQFSVRIGIKLDNGAEIVLEYAFTKEQDGVLAGSYKIDFENSTDSNGNPLIIRPNLGGPNGGGVTFRANYNTIHNFLRAAQRAGIPIVGGGSGVVSCTWVDAETIVCTLQP